MWRAAFKNGKRSYVRTDGQAKHWQQLSGRDRIHPELNHSSAGAWSDPVDIDSREPEIKATFPHKNGGKYYSMIGMDASQGNYALADGSVV